MFFSSLPSTALIVGYLWASFFAPLCLAKPIDVPTKIPADKYPDIIPNQYIVVLKPTSDLASHTAWLSKRDLSDATASVTNTYSFGNFRGYALTIPESSSTSRSTLLNDISSNPDVLSIEPDRIVTIADQAFTRGGSTPSNTQEKRAIVTQSPIPSWGLGRISHRIRGATKYPYDSSAGEGTFAYVLDTGIYPQHVQFEGRATIGSNFSPDPTGVDGNGHGTFMAGIIAGREVGVAKKARIIGVKVLSNSGSGATSQVIAGIQWCLVDAQTNSRVGKSVISMAIGGSFSTAMNNAVNNVVLSGLAVTVAAGSSNALAANYSPSSAVNAFTIGATTQTDAKASSSNYGSAIDWWAPGQQITSLFIGSPTAVNTISGTTAAQAHVAGLCLYLYKLHPTITSVPLLAQKITELATVGVITGLDAGSPNLLVYNGSGF